MGLGSSYCVFCCFEPSLPDKCFCSVECARLYQLSERLLDLKHILIELKYGLKELSDKTGGLR